MKHRRVVTGVAGLGKSVIASDDLVEPIIVALAPGTAFHPIWGTDEPPTLPQNGTGPAVVSWFPPPGGFRFTFKTIPPASAAVPPEDLTAAMTEAAEKLPALLDTGSPGKPRLHRSNTIGFVVILSGRLWLEVDDGHELELRQGECVILNGGLHAWHNRSPTPCEIAAVTIGARRLSDTDPPLFRS